MQSTRRSFLTAAAATAAVAGTPALALDKRGRDRDWTGNTPVSYTEPAWEVIDKKLNGPNDAAVTADGAIWFTDAGYGMLGSYEGHKDVFELPCNVYRLDSQTGRAEVVFGGHKRNRLFMAGSTSLYSMHVNAQGAKTV